MDNIKIFAFADEANDSIDGQIKAMKRNGLDGLEIRGVDGTNIGDITVEKAKEVKEKLDAAGLITWSLGSPYGKIDIDADFVPHLEKFKRGLEIAHTLEAKHIRMFSFFMPKDADIDGYREEVIDRLGQMLEVAHGSGILLCHENEKGIFGDNAKRCLSLFRALPELRGVFDPANFVQCDQDTIEAWEMLDPYIHYMHIKDSLTDGNIVPAGEGAGNIPTIAAAYRARGGFAFTMEPHLSEFSGLAGLEKEGDTSLVGLKHVYRDNDESFDAACAAFKALL